MHLQILLLIYFDNGDPLKLLPSMCPNMTHHTKLYFKFLVTNRAIKAYRVKSIDTGVGLQ